LEPQDKYRENDDDEQGQVDPQDLKPNILTILLDQDDTTMLQPRIPKTMFDSDNKDLKKSSVESIPSLQPWGAITNKSLLTPTTKWNKITNGKTLKMIRHIDFGNLS
jgi:hypothetical protein